MTEVHRNFYPSAKGEQSSHLKPVARAGPVVDERGVAIEFFVPSRRYTPTELRMLARWLYALSHESVELAQNGLVGEGKAYDVEKSKPADPPADN